MSPIAVAVTFSLVEGATGEIKPGRVPDGLRRLARTVAMARPGQKMDVSNLYGQMEDDRFDGTSLEIETNIGVNRQMIDLIYDFRFGGLGDVRTISCVTLWAGQPLYVPLSQTGNRSIGLLLEAQVLDPRGDFFGE